MAKIMSSKIKARDAIDFLAMVRKDLEIVKPGLESASTVVSGRFSEIDVRRFSNAEPDCESATPSFLGRFEVVKQIGEGGFAKVFLANDPNLDRPVALKVPKPHVLLSAESRARFEREAKSAAILSHPNIVPVFECGASGPIHFIASEYCSGPTLQQWLTSFDKPPAPRTVVEIVCRLADALQHAHHRGIIHRDLKPANIILISSNKDLPSRLRITDFGLARQVSDQDSLTEHGAIVGTPAYMSPEQAEGIVEVDHRTDIHSLGMILYEMLMGTAPFKRKNHAASIAAVINESVPMLCSANPQVDRDLEAICLKALQKEPASRYESAHDFRRDLLRWLDGRAVSVRKLSQPETFRRWLTRNPLVASAVSFGIASLAIGLLFSASQWNQAQTNLQQSNLQRVRAEKNAEQLHGTLVKALEISLDALEKDPEVSPSQQQVLDELMLAHKQLIDEEAEQVEITAKTFDCYERLIRIYRNSARYEEAYAICDQAEKMIDRCFATEAGRQKFGMCATEVFLQRGLVADDLSDREVQQSSYSKSIELLLESEPHVDRLAWLEKGFRVYRNWGFTNFSRDNEKCRAAFELAAQCANEALELDPKSELSQFNAAMCYSDMGHLDREGENWMLSLERLEEAERRFTEIAANPESELDYRYRLCYIRSEICWHLRVHVKDYERAEEYIRKSLDGLKELVEEFPGLNQYTNRLSHVYLRLIDVYRDQEMFDEVMALIPEANEVHGLATPKWCAMRRGLTNILAGRIYANELDEPGKAEVAFDAAIDELEASDYFSLSNDHTIDTLLDAFRHKSMLYDAQRQSTRAIEVAGDGYRLAVQRALSIPNDHNIDKALHRGKYYAHRLAKIKKFGHAKSVLDTLSEAGAESMKAQYEVAHFWAKMDFLQREAGAEKSLWEASRANSISHLSKAIELGFDDHERLVSGQYFREYRHLTKFKTICDRIKQ